MSRYEDLDPFTKYKYLGIKEEDYDPHEAENIAKRMLKTERNPPTTRVEDHISACELGLPQPIGLVSPPDRPNRDE